MLTGIQNQLQELRLVLVALLITLMLLSLGLNLFIARQWKTVTNQAIEQRAIQQRASTEFRAKEPRVKGFITVLHQFAATNKDFQPVLAKYHRALESFYPPGYKAPVAPILPTPSK